MRAPQGTPATITMAVNLLGDGPSGPPEESDVESGTVAFVPSGVTYSVQNTGDEDLATLTGMAHRLVERANPLYDERRKAWGGSRKRRDRMLVGKESVQNEEAICPGIQVVCRRRNALRCVSAEELLVGANGE